jgi:hypothetical protein
MKGYEESSKLIKEIEKSLSLGEKASADTALRKLQSVMRNNVNTNFGNREKLVEVLKNAGADNVLEKLAGQSLNSWTPRGLGKIVAGGTGAAALATTNPALLPLIAAQSPRLVGEASYYGGKAAGGTANLLKLLDEASPGGLYGARMGAYQAGRVNELSPD